MAIPAKEAKDLLGFDYYNVFEANLTDKQRDTRDRIRNWIQNRVLPNINPYWEKAEFPYELFYESKRFRYYRRQIDRTWYSRSGCR